MTEPLTLGRLDWSDVLARSCEWERLRAVAPTETPFLTPDWLETWWRHLGPGPPARPSLLVVRSGAEARAIAPLHRARIGGTGLVALRPLGLAVSDYLDLLLPTQAERRRACLATLLDGLIVRPSSWDALDLPNLPAESPTVAGIAAEARRWGLPCRVMPGYPRPAIALDRSWDAYLATRPGRFRYNLRSRLRRLGEHGAVRFRTAAGPDEVRQVLGELVRLHARRWQGQHTSTIFSSSARGRAFYAEACPRCAARGLLDLTVLEVGGRVAAGAVGFVERETFYYYLPVWEPELATYAPSSLLLAHLIERSFERGLRRFDFMLGDEPYKAGWATEERQTVRVVIGNRTVRGRAAYGALVGWHHLRERARTSDTLRRIRRYGIAKGISHQLSAVSRQYGVVIPKLPMSSRAERGMTMLGPADR